DAAPGHRRLRRHSRDRRVPHLRHRLDDLGRRPGPLDRALQHLRLYRGVPVPQFRPRLGGRDDRRAHHRRLRAPPLSRADPRRRGVEVTAVAAALPGPERAGFWGALAPGGKRVLFALAVIAVCLLFAFPIFWLVLTSLRPGYAVFYVHRGTD